MARNIALIENETSQYSDNLLPIFDGTINITSGTAGVIYQTKNPFKGDKCIKITHADTANNIFNFGSYGFTAKEDGVYIFSYKFFKLTPSHSIVFKCNVFVNGVLITNNTLTQTLHNSTVGFSDTKYNTFSQNISLVTNDVVTFTFESQSNTAASVLFFDALKFEFDNKGLGLSSVYSLPNDQTTGWQSRTDVVNSQVLTANIDNLIAFTGTLDENGGVTLLNSNAKILPTKLGDSIGVDFVFTFPSPAGTSDFYSIKLKVNGFIYRAQSFSILEPTGQTNYASASFLLPVGTDFKTYGAEFFVNPSVNITISNRYIQATKVHNGI